MSEKQTKKTPTTPVFNHLMLKNLLFNKVFRQSQSCLHLLWILLGTSPIFCTSGSSCRKSCHLIQQIPKGKPYSIFSFREWRRMHLFLFHLLPSEVSNIFWLVTKPPSSQKQIWCISFLSSPLSKSFPEKYQGTEKKLGPFVMSKTPSLYTEAAFVPIHLQNSLITRPCFVSAFSNLSDTGLMLISPKPILGQGSLPG